MKINYRAYFPSSKTRWHVGTSWSFVFRVKLSNSFKFIIYIVYKFLLDLNFISISRSPFLDSEMDKKSALYIILRNSLNHTGLITLK